MGVAYLKATRADAAWEVWLEQLRQGNTTRSRNRRGQFRRPGIPESERKVVIASIHPEGALAMEGRVTYIRPVLLQIWWEDHLIRIIWEACKNVSPWVTLQNSGDRAWKSGLLISLSDFS